MTQLQTKLITDTWLKGSWEDYLKIIEQPIYKKAKSYYNQGLFRIEMSPLGHDHASDHSIINYAINLYASVKGIDLNGFDNCSYRKSNYQEAQPDLSYYIGNDVNVIPYGTSIVNLNQYPSPTLVVEIANTSLADDKGEKRILYEDLEVKEYWIVDVKNIAIFAFSIKNQGSFRINESQVLSGLEISILKQALQRTRTENHSQVGAWLLQQFQK